MINILPESGRAHVKREYFLRLTSSALFLLALLFLLCAVMLVPSYLFATVARQQAEAEEARIATAQKASNSGEAATLVSANSQAKALDALLSAPKGSQYLSEVLALAAATISVVHVSYGQGDMSMAVSGEAATRDALLSFTKALKTIPGVVSVDLPVGDLARDVKIPFNVSVTFSK